ncbi:MAG: hypothetical protein A2092_19170 [Rhodobacteraceae bacterium GWE1_64_9]|nr:MAG: hypothetical protein A2092_19170 [Rhodobacteraceae bacterium GWE1_64_9]OHC49658.1 MAG: hypothetical protein A2X69_17100 [Rhodobacteraceae bacterium GWF1_65_7]HBD92106.1 hypothetical protein [Gemmobacter sp.]HBU14432.1 hypothetical protein [Gemmobacter sp.]
MKQLTFAVILLSLTLSAAIFGFFYAWVCSTMWGLDAADPRVAIGAMQAMNASVRNAVFAPIFFGTPFALAAAAALLLTGRQRRSAAAFAAAAIVYFCLGLVLTMSVNVPMNEALAKVDIPADVENARAIWQGYSGPWQVWNQIRTVGSGIAFFLAVSGLLMMERRRV